MCIYSLGDDGNVEYLEEVGIGMLSKLEGVKIFI